MLEGEVRLNNIVQVVDDFGVYILDPCRVKKISSKKEKEYSMLRCVVVENRIKAPIEWLSSPKLDDNLLVEKCKFEVLSDGKNMQFVKEGFIVVKSKDKYYYRDLEVRHLAHLQNLFFDFTYSELC